MFVFQSGELGNISEDGSCPSFSWIPVWRFDKPRWQISVYQTCCNQMVWFVRSICFATFTFPETFNAKKHVCLESHILIMIVSWFGLFCFFWNFIGALLFLTNNNKDQHLSFHNTQETHRSQQTRDSLRQLGAKKDLLNLDSYLLDRHMLGHLMVPADGSRGLG